MRTRSITGFAAALLLLSAGSVLAQGPPKPPAELSQIAYFEGTWSCEGKMNESPMGPAGPMKSTVEIRKDLGGYFQTGLIKGTMPNQPPFEGRFYATYDPAAKQFVMLWVDSMGGWANNTSSGWKGDTLVYEGVQRMGPESMKGRDTFIRSGAGTLKHVFEAEMKGKWMTLGEETCKKK